jgi:hypothetical protein
MVLRNGRFRENIWTIPAIEFIILLRGLWVKGGLAGRNCEIKQTVALLHRAKRYFKNVSAFQKCFSFYFYLTLFGKTCIFQMQIPA